MALLSPYSKVPELNTATVLLVENEEELQNKLANAIVQHEKDFNVNVRLAKKLPLPVENKEARPRIDLIVFIVSLLSERSLQSAESSLSHLHSDCFLGKVCFLVTDARCGSHTQERLVSVRKLAASHHCPVICAEHRTADGVSAAALRLLNILQVSAGMTPMSTTALYLSTLTRCSLTSDLQEDYLQ
uniref:Centromere protein M n=1 Tax=Danio rerio TaxID=7955 RepID=CENPM_DANRE|nr:RecName: Full=Centromere protein M; Short=CENP-M; AltName: Full=Proliferation-associated nuclear element 1 [Danio rerio]AAP33276.1 proliferation associated nuclear element 1 [Danio rerio]